MKKLLERFFGLRRPPEGWSQVPPNERRNLIRRCRSLKQLEEMWAEWELRGQSREGILYSEVLKRRRELGGGLSDIEEKQLSRIEEAVARGRRLPPISGNFRM
jgi:hypothetical protein